MRKTLLTLTLVTLLALPVLAQRQPRGGFGGGMQGGDMLLMNKSVQEELKFTDAQKKIAADVAKATTELREKMMEAFKDKDKEKATELRTKITDETAKGAKKIKESLNSVQAKRFEQIEVQVATKSTDPKIFNRDFVKAALKLTDKQKETVKEEVSNFEKDAKEVMDDIKGDFRKMRDAMTKVGGMRKEAYEKITKSLSEDQVKTYKTLGGDAFELKMERGGFGKDKGKGKRGDKKKDTDF
jgi:hypothetical protein